MSAETGIPPPFELRTLRPADAEAGLRLSRLAGWNQTARDWRFLLQHGQGWGVFHPEAGLVASAVAMDLSAQATWISMVLTDPAWRRRGLAARLMQVAVEWGQRRGRTSWLDATPEGETVYRQMGFAGEVRLARWRLAEAAAAESSVPAGIRIRPMQAADLARVRQGEAERTGWERRELLPFLFQGAPGLAFAALGKGNGSGEEEHILGYLLGRAGDRATHLGPIVAMDPDLAQALLQRALKAIRGPVILDAFEAQATFLGFLSQLGFQRERGFRRMALGTARGSPPFTAASCFASAGPELG